MSGTNPTGSESLSVSQAAEMLAESGLLDSLMPDDGEHEEQVQGEAEEVNPEDETEADEVEEDSDSDGDEDTDEDQEQPETITVKVDGEEVQVTLDELKSGYSRTQDYTRKTQEVAETRKAVQAELQQVQAERQQYAQVLGQLAQQFEVQEPDWDHLRQTDPIEYSLQMADYQRNQQKRQVAQQEQQRVMAQIQQDNMKQMQDKLGREAEALSALIPEWKDAEKVKVVKAMVKEQGKKLGFSDEEMSQVFDHRAILALRKAALYDELMSKRETVKPKATQKTLKPSGKGNPGNSDARKALARATTTGHQKDVARAIEFLL